MKYIFYPLRESVKAIYWDVSMLFGGWCIFMHCYELEWIERRLCQDILKAASLWQAVTPACVGNLSLTCNFLAISCRLSSDAETALLLLFREGRDERSGVPSTCIFLSIAFWQARHFFILTQQSPHDRRCPHGWKVIIAGSSSHTMHACMTLECGEKGMISHAKLPTTLQTFSSNGNKYIPIFNKDSITRRVNNEKVPYML